MTQLKLQQRDRECKSYRKTCDQLRKRNQDLTHEMNQREEANLKVVSSWQEKATQLEATISELQERITHITEQNEADRNYAEDVFEGKIKMVEDELAHSESKLSAENKRLTEQLQSLNDFAQRQEQMKQQLMDVTMEKKELEEREAENKRQRERKFIEEKARLQNDINKRLVAFKKASEERVTENLDASTKRILTQNRQMADELRLHVQETNELLKVKSRLEIDRKRISRDAELQKESVEQFAKKGARHNRDLRNSSAKVKSLERSLSRVVHEFEVERAQLQAQLKQMAGERDTQLGKMTTQLKARDRELKTIRRLAKDILRQRSDVEQFFLDSLQLVREQISASQRERQKQAEAEYRQQIRDATLDSKRVSFPKITARGAANPGMFADPSSLPTSAEQKVDLAELSWEDKEQVLRLLFAKINHAQQQRVAQVDEEARDEFGFQEFQEMQPGVPGVDVGMGMGGAVATPMSPMRTSREEHMMMGGAGAGLDRPTLA